MNRYRRILRSYQATSRDARQAIEHLLPAVDAQIVGFIRRANGATSEEIEHALQMKHQTVSAQIRQMVEGGVLERSDRTRKTAGGRPAIVWVLSSAVSPAPPPEAVALSLF